MGFFGRKLRLASDFWSFMKVRKKWWLAPIIILLLIGSILIIAGGSALSPFIYALF
jgi:hypothetical protein